MLTDLTLAEALAALGEPRVIVDEALVPAECPPADHSPYRPGYEWLFCAERRLARALEPWLLERRHQLIGPGGVLSETLANAFCHGHRRDPRRAIHVRVTVGDHGLLVRVKDGGAGFDAARVTARLRRGERYFEVAGNGFRALARSEAFLAFFDEGGSAVYLLHPFALPS